MYNIIHAILEFAGISIFLTALLIIVALA